MIHHRWRPGWRAERRRARILEQRIERRHVNQAGASRTAAETTESGRVSLAVVVAGKLVALFALLAISGLLYDGAVSPSFRVRRVAVSGTRLLSPQDVLGAAAVEGQNVFRLRRADVAERVRQIPAVRGVQMRVALPDRVEIVIDEREPYATWHAGSTSFLVDSDGLIISDREPEQPLIVIQDLDSPSLAPGARVDRGALQTVAALNAALPRALRHAPRQYDYSRALGVEFQAQGGPRVRFGSSEGIEAKVATLIALQQELARAGERVELIDVRFLSRPYYR